MLTTVAACARATAAVPSVEPSSTTSTSSASSRGTRRTASPTFASSSYAGAIAITESSRYMARLPATIFDIDTTAVTSEPGPRAPDVQTRDTPPAARSDSSREGAADHRSAWHVAACAVFLAATLLVLGDVLLAGNRLVLSMPGEDMTRPFFYWFPFGFGELRRGHLVLWNPYNYAGAPFFGGFGPALLYPPNWLHLVLPTAVAINVGIALHLFLAGLWTYAWTRHRDLHPAACILAGLVFMFGG